MKRENPWLELFSVLSIAFVVILLATCAKAAELPPRSPNVASVWAIIGEAEGETYQGKLAVACAIRNRGNLKGVYGKNKLVQKEDGKLYRKTKKGLRPISEKAQREAVKAWFESKEVDVTKGASGWGNASDILLFQKEGWWKNCTVTAVVGNHVFYRESIR